MTIYLPAVVWSHIPDCTPNPVLPTWIRHLYGGWAQVPACRHQLNVLKKGYTWWRHQMNISWWRHQMEIFFTLLAFCAGKSPVPGEFPAQRPVTRSFEVFFDICAWINDWVNIREAGDLRRHRAHYDDTVMKYGLIVFRSFWVILWVFYFSMWYTNP